MSFNQNSQTQRRWFPPVYSFSCFRNFLNTYAQSMKDKDPQFNYSAWARDLGLKATTSITMVLHGQRTCGPQIRQKLESYFGFDEQEKKYFDCLVRVDRFSEDATMKQLVLEELKRIVPKKQHPTLTSEDLQKLEIWFQQAMEQLFSIKKFSDEQISEIVSWLQVQAEESKLQKLAKT